MGAGTSNAQDPLPNQTYKEFQEHPLFASIENPINRFCDDFASSLVQDINSNNPKDIQMDVAKEDEIMGYTIVKILGDGAEAVVYEARHNRKNVTVALKKYKKVLHMGKKDPREYEISALLDHPNCIKMENCFQNSLGEYIIAMPLGPYGSLSYSTVPVLTVSAAILFLHQLGSALAHMHSRNVVHRDIKPGNILLFDNGFVLCDYSVSVHLSSPNEQLSGVVGTSIFMSWEISNNMYMPKPVDVWALGVTIYVLTFGKFPYHLEEALELNEGQAWNNTAPIQQCVSTYELEFPKNPDIPDEMKDVICGMLHKDPKKRITAQQIADNTWIKQKCDEWQELLNFMRDDASASEET